MRFSALQFNFHQLLQSGLEDEALMLFVVALRNEIKPTEFTFATILNSRSVAHQLSSAHKFIDGFVKRALGLI